MLQTVFRWAARAMPALLLLACASAQAQNKLFLRSQTYAGLISYETLTVNDTNGAFTSTGNSSDQISVTGGGYSLKFRVPSGQTLAVGEYEATEIYQSDVTSRTAMYVYAQNYNWYCNTVTGRFRILELTRDAQGAIVSLALNFQQHCNNSYSAVMGQLRFNSAIATDEGRRTPDYMIFQPVTNATPGAAVTSNSATIGGLDAPIAISIAGGEYSINNGTFTSAAVAVQNGDTIRVRIAVPAAIGTRATAHVDFNGYRSSFAVGNTIPTAPQPVYSMVQLYGQSAGGYSSARTVLLSPLTMQTLRLSKASYDGVTRGIRIESMEPYSSTSFLNLNFYAPQGNTITAGEYPNLAASPVSNQSALVLGYGGYSSILGSSVYCYDSTSPIKATVHEVEYASDGMPSKLAMDFVITCYNGSYGRVFGYVRINSTRAVDYTRTLPAQFQFPGVSDAQLNTQYTSQSGTVDGINVAVPITVSGGEYSIAGGPFTAAAGTISNGQTVRARLTSASTANTLRVATLNIGGAEFPFKVGTAVVSLPQPGTDAMMVQVSVPRAENQALVTRVYTPATLATFVFQASQSYPKQFQVLARKSGNSSEDLSVSFGGLSGERLVPGTYTDVASYNDNSRVMVNQQQQGCYAGAPFGLLVVHEIEYDVAGTPTKAAIDYRIDCSTNSTLSEQYNYLRFNSTVPIDYTINRPAPFSFTSVKGANPGDIVTSNQVTMRAINVSVPISVVGGEYAIEGGAFTSASGLVAPGQKVRVRTQAAADANAVKTVTLTAGVRGADFLVGTDPGVSPQPNGSPMVVIQAQNYNGSATRQIYSAGTLHDVGLGQAATYYARTSVEMKRLVPNLDGSIPATVMYLSGPNGSLLDVGTYLDAVGNSGSPERAYVSPFNNFYPSYGAQEDLLPYCYSSGSILPTSTRFIVREIESSLSGQTLKLALDMVRTCGIYDLQNVSGPAAIFTSVRINSTIPIDYELRQPVPFVLSPVPGVAPGTAVESAAFTIRGITVAVPIAVTGGQYSIDGGAFTATAGTVSAGQVVKVRLTASPLANDLRTAVISVGEYSTEFKVGTAPGSNPPANGAPLMLMISQGNEVIGQGRTDVVSPATFRTIVASRDWYAGNVNVTANPMVGSSGASWQVNVFAPQGTLIMPGTYTQITNGSYPVTGRMGLRASSNGNYCYNYTSDLYPAGTSMTVHEIEYAGTGTYDPPTKVAIDFVLYCAGNPDPLYGYIRINSSVAIQPLVDNNPSPFSFAPVGSATRNAAIVSASASLTGFNVALPISVIGGEYSIDGGAFTAMPGIVNSGQTVRARVIASASFGGTAKATITVGSRSGEFAVTSEYADSYPDLPVFPSATAAPRSSWVVSAAQVLTGFNSPASIYMYAGEYSINGGPFTSAQGTVMPGDSLRLRVMTGAIYGASYSAQLAVSGYYVYFQVQTVQQAVIQVSINGSGSVRFDPAGVTCSATCGQLFDQGTQLTLTATPSAGQGFAGWSGGGCSGTGQCTIALDLTAQVTATFAALPPGAPTLTAAAPGDGRVTLVFASPASNGGSAITSYQATCMPGTITASGTGSPLVVTGLANGTAYQCTVAATNANGTGAASNALSVTPDALAISLVAVQSRKTHGAAGVFDLPVDASQPIGGPVTVEPRSIGAGHNIVFQMSDNITAIGSVTVVDAADAPIGSATASFSGNEVIVVLTGTPDNRRAKVQVNNINGTATVSAALGFLVGDVNGSRSVNASDISGVKARSGQTVDVSNFKFDLNTSGGINATDISAAKPRSGLVLP
jgi:hypothetical protein